jgi:hypothetical protein
MPPPEELELELPPPVEDVLVLELEELLLEEDELLLDELEELLDEELELEELLLDEELELEELEEPVPGSLTTVQDVGAAKVPSWVPWKPKMWVAVAPGAGFCQPGQHSVNWKVVPGLVPVRVAFHWLVIVTCSGNTTENTKASVSLTVPVLVTLISTWNPLAVLDGVVAQVCAANA